MIKRRWQSRSIMFLGCSVSLVWRPHAPEFNRTLTRSLVSQKADTTEMFYPVCPALVPALQSVHMMLSFVLFMLHKAYEYLHKKKTFTRSDGTVFIIHTCTYSSMKAYHLHQHFLSFVLDYLIPNLPVVVLSPKSIASLFLSLHMD